MEIHNQGKITDFIAAQLMQHTTGKHLQILEDDEKVIRSMKPAPGFLQIEYKNGGKSWHYALIPHNAITSNRSFDRLMSEYMAQAELV